MNSGLAIPVKDSILQRPGGHTEWSETVGIKWDSHDSLARFCIRNCSERRENCLKIPHGNAGTTLQMSLHSCVVHLPLPLLWSLLP